MDHFKRCRAALWALFLGIGLAGPGSGDVQAGSLSIQKARYKSTTLTVDGSYRGAALPADGMAHLYDRKLGSRIASLALSDAPQRGKKRPIHFALSGLGDVPCAVRMGAAGARDKFLKVKGAPRNGCSKGGTAPPPDGNNSGPIVPGTTAPFPTYRRAGLPGRMLVVVNDKAELYDLQTGERRVPPSSPQLPDLDRWNISGDGGLLVRQNIRFKGATQIDFIDPISLTLARPGVTLDKKYQVGFTGVRASAGGAYLVGFISYDSNSERYLTIFDGHSGEFIAPDGSNLGTLVLSDPAAWLPKGDEYVYLAGNVLYASAPGHQSDRQLGTLSGLPFNDSNNNRYYPHGFSNVVVSPDGQRVAFTWGEDRKGTNTRDLHVWVSNLDGTGLHRLTEIPDATYPVGSDYRSPTWSPDGR